MYANNSAAFRDDAPILAVQRVDQALAMLSAAYMRNNGKYNACLNSFQGFSEIDQLPSAEQPMLVEFLDAMAPQPDLDSVDQARVVVASLTEDEALQIIDDLYYLKHRLV